MKKIWVVLGIGINVDALLVLIVGAILGAQGGTGHVHNAAMDFLTAGGVTLFIYWFLALSVWIGNHVIEPVWRPAVTPVPSPAEIAYQLEAETGVKPSLQDVAAVHQMLTERRNGAIVTAGALAALVYGIHKEL